jgi:hypothetical protein
MTAPNTKAIQSAILSILDETALQKAHKFNLIGRPHQRGALEQRLGITFDSKIRMVAATVCDDLKTNGYIQPTFTDLADPENWIQITDAGRQFLQRGLRDHVDSCLAQISEHLIELRAGMRDSVTRTSPDAPRQAVNSARELIDQVLKEGTPGDCKTRKQRIKHLLHGQRPDSARSNSDIEIVEACCGLIEAEQNKAIAMSHARAAVSPEHAQLAVDAAERALKLFFSKHDPN